MMALSSSVLSNNPGKAESGTNFGGCGALDVAPPPQLASAKLRASAPKRLRFTELGVRTRSGAGLLHLHGLVVHLGGGGVQRVAWNVQTHLHQ